MAQPVRSLALLLLAAGPAAAQDERVYVPETDPLAVEKLERWQDVKLGLLLHWGPYSQWGIVESWSLCSEDEDWCRRPRDSEYGEYKREYEALPSTFDPVGFDPDRWAEAARDAGMRYVVFTTKHHDGFSMWDTDQTDYRITGPGTAFAADPRADVTAGIFDAFRARGFMIGAYFSKPDWHHPDYWWPYFATPDRHPNYDVTAYPERWRRFVDFTHAQIGELMSDYGSVDILWLDGGWVRERSPEELERRRAQPGFPKQRYQSLPIDMQRLVADARERQPGLIVVDRAVPGPYQNYLTPEARVPDGPIEHPFEVPIPMATSWSFVPDDPYKTPRELVHMLVDVVAKGGNLLLNIGPGPDGTWHDEAYDRLEALGDWMEVNGGAIYGTRRATPWGEGPWRFTAAPDGSVNAIRLVPEGEVGMPSTVDVPGVTPAAGAVVTLVGPETTLDWEATDDGIRVNVSVGTEPPSAHAWTLRVSAVEPRPAAYRDTALPIEERVGDLLARMTREEKFWQLYMSPGDRSDPSHDYANGSFGLQIPEDTTLAPAEVARDHAERINRLQAFFVDSTRLGIPLLPFDEALHGLKRAGATAFPQAIGLAATFDTALVGSVARAIADETRSRGIRQVLSPVVNIAEDVRWGRTEETYGEDPLLSSLMGVAFTRAFETAGVVATPKHFVANVGAGGRDSWPIHWNRRYLEDVHFPPFRTAIEEGGARSIMTSYNSVDGTPATQNEWLLTETLRDSWGFRGFAISDMSATGGPSVLHLTETGSTGAGAHAWASGLDVVFQSRWEEHRPYLRAVTGGLVPDSVLDRSVRRVLRAKMELGLFEDPFVDPDEAARLNGHAGHRGLAREAAEKSLVLLTNRGDALPLDREALGSLAVIGIDAVEGRLGGYSGPGVEPVSILDGLRAELPGSEVRYAPGPGRLKPGPTVVPASLTGEYFANTGLEGDPEVVRTDEGVDVHWTLGGPAPGIARDWYSVRWTGPVTAPEGGVRRIGVEGDDGWRLWIDGELALDRSVKGSYGTHLAELDWEAGSTHDVRLEYVETRGYARVRLVWEAGPERDPDAPIEEAVALARDADATVLVVGIEEGEFRDRSSLALPGRQEELVRAVAAGAAGPVVVVIVGGSAVTMPWLDEVDAVLMAWYPGERGGPAVADVLMGDVGPAGRLPITFPLDEGQLPLVYNPTPTGRGNDYLDLSGDPLFSFGHGLTYTRFEYADLAFSADTIRPTDSVTVSATVTNIGARAGDEVVQLYLRDLLATTAQPVIRLAGFERIALEPGESRVVTFRLGPDDLAILNDTMRRVVEPGTFRVWVGASSADLKLRGALEVR